MAHMLKKPMIERIEITPNDDGTLSVEVRHRCKHMSDGKMSPMSYEDRTEKRSFPNASSLGKFMDELFPIPTMTQSEGKSESHEGGGSRVDTYTGA